MATVNFKGAPVELSGDPPTVGSTAPEFELVDTDMSSVKLSDTNGKYRIISVVPSIDTKVCEIQTRQFNNALENFSDNVVGYTISVDTPFAQKRWCGVEGVEKMKLLSDYKGNTFGRHWGLYINDLGLLARSVFIVNPEGEIVYTELVPETGQEPDYKSALDKLKEYTS